MGCAFAATALSNAACAQDIAPQSAQANLTCPLETINTGTVQRVLDGRTLLLTDGREVRLAGIEVSHPAASAEGAHAAKTALEALTNGRELTLKRHGSGSDRHGRVVAHAFIQGAEPDAAAWIQKALLASGHARAAARIGPSGCAAPLFAAEKAARAARLGLWGDPYYVVRRAETPGEVLAERGRFTVVEGRVLSVRESGGTIYVNFGRRWSEDFTVTVLKRSERAFADAGLELRKLAGRVVRVRGTIEERGGPWIEATAPEQFEIAE